MNCTVVNILGSAVLCFALACVAVPIIEGSWALIKKLWRLLRWPVVVLTVLELAKDPIMVEIGVALCIGFGSVYGGERAYRFLKQRYWT